MKLAIVCPVYNQVPCEFLQAIMGLRIDYHLIMPYGMSNVTAVRNKTIQQITAIKNLTIKELYNSCFFEMDELLPHTKEYIIYRLTLDWIATAYRTNNTILGALK